jgi:hypothetical protein
VLFGNALLLGALGAGHLAAMTITGEASLQDDAVANLIK